MNTSLHTDFQNRKVTKGQMNDDINEIRGTYRINYFKDEAQRMQLLKESGGILYFTSEIIKDLNNNDLRVTAWVYEVPELMRFYHPDYAYCILAGFILRWHAMTAVLAERLEDDELGNGTKDIEKIPTGTEAGSSEISGQEQQGAWQPSSAFIDGTDKI